MPRGFGSRVGFLDNIIKGKGVWKYAMIKGVVCRGFAYLEADLKVI